MYIVIYIKDKKYRTKIRNIFFEIKEKFELNESRFLNSTSPEEVLEHVNNHIGNTIYFLDADLCCNSNSVFDLARKIREKDWQCQIVFISNHSEMFILSFQHKILAMDCLIKTSADFEIRIEECILFVIRRLKKHVSTDCFTFTYADEIINISRDDVIFIESVPNNHKVILHFRRSEKKFDSCQLNENLEILNEKLGSDFIRCHRSYIVNRRHILSINKKIRTLAMSNGSTCYYSRNNAKYILQID